MTPLANGHFIIRCDLGARVAETPRDHGKVQQNIELRNHGCALPDAAGLFCNPISDFLEESLFDIEDAFFGGENFFFVLLQLGSRKAFGADEGLLAVVVFGRQMQIGIRNFDVIAEYLIKAHFE